MENGIIPNVEQVQSVSYIRRDCIQPIITDQILPSLNLQSTWRCSKKCYTFCLFFSQIPAERFAMVPINKRVPCINETVCLHLEFCVGRAHYLRCVEIYYPTFLIVAKSHQIGLKGICSACRHCSINKQLTT